MNLKDIEIQKVNLGDKNYPKNLAKIKNPPQTLYYRGILNEELFKKSLAVVGSRRMTRYGKMVIEKFIPSLVKAKITIISGFMYGIDTEAHQKCLEYGGKTVAVLGGGLNVIYPPENEKLYFQIIKNGGVIISEYPPDFKPQLWTFPQRNRIISGLSSLGVLVVEAGEKSGALITAKFARQQGKKVYAIPGPITSLSSWGTNWLIKNHFAKMVTTPEEILGKKSETISLFSLQDLSETETKIIEVLKNEPLTADEMAQILEKEIKEINQNLSLLAIKGIIFEDQGKYYLKI
ncbi:MAG: DNA-processing protein DprA [Microgenomates group bacterium]